MARAHSFRPRDLSRREPAALLGRTACIHGAQSTRMVAIAPPSRRKHRKRPTGRGASGFLVTSTLRSAAAGVSSSRGLLFVTGRTPVGRASREDAASPRRPPPASRASGRRVPIHRWSFSSGRSHRAIPVRGGGSYDRWEEYRHQRAVLRAPTRTPAGPPPAAHGGRSVGRPS
jgi:hypothetical protein